MTYDDIKEILSIVDRAVSAGRYKIMILDVECTDDIDLKSILIQKLKEIQKKHNEELKTEWQEGFWHGENDA